MICILLSENFKKIGGIVFLVIGLNCPVKGQSDFRPGIVVTMQGDTIFGEIEQRGDIHMAKVCSFRSSSTQEATEYLPLQISSFRIKNGRYYVSKVIQEPKKDSIGVVVNTRVFLEFLVQGKMNLYYLRDTKGDHYFIEKENEELVELKYEEKIKEVEGQRYFTKSKTHVGLLFLKTKDAPELRPDIENIETPNATNMVRLATKYHTLVCKDQKCVVFSKTPEPIKVSVEGVLGGAVYKAPYIENKINYNGGLLIHFRFPSTDKNFFLKTGLVYSEWIYYEKKTPFVKFPLHFEFVSNGNILKARFSVGPNYYTNQFLTFSSVAGVLVKIVDKVHLSYNVEIESPLGFRTNPLDFNLGMQFGMLIGL